MLARICRTRKFRHFLPRFFYNNCHGVQNSSVSSLLYNAKPISDVLSSFGLQSVTRFSTRDQINAFSREGNFNEIACQTRLICPGCGVHMQDLNPKYPGFYIKPSPKGPDYKTPVSHKFVLDESEATDSLKRGVLNDLLEVEPQKLPVNPNFGEKPVVCARCHSLRHYGKVKDVSVENLLPDFDFDHTIGRKLASASGVRSVVLMVVDASDFDGSFPKKVAKLVSMTIDENLMAWKEGKSGNVPRLVLVLSKLDLLPSSISPTRLEHWVRRRARECGANKLTSVHMVSAVRDWGVTNLIDDVTRLVGTRGNVWAVGAQNAGKSTLINAIGKHVSKKVVTQAAPITEAPVPGTTLGIIRMEGILPGKAKLFDTPGLLLPHNIATRLTRDEQKLVQICKELRPRTYRIQVGQTVHVAGLLRLDIEKLSADSVYITVWASPFLILHMGKTKNADKVMTDNFGRHLQPPIGDERVEEIGKWVRREFHVTGTSWDASSVDVAAAGVGWFAIGIKGEATVGVWTYDGVEVIQRNALLPHRATQFEVAGFTVSKLVADSDKISNKIKNRNRESKAACGKLIGNPL